MPAAATCSAAEVISRTGEKYEKSSDHRIACTGVALGLNASTSARRTEKAPATHHGGRDLRPGRFDRLHRAASRQRQRRRDDHGAGPWSGTISFFASGDGGATWNALNVTPSNSTTAVTTATANGTWQINPAGYTHVCAAFTTATSGTVVATIQLSTASARTSGGGGGGAPTGTAGGDL